MKNITLIIISVLLTLSCHTALVAQVQQYGVIKEYRGTEEKVPIKGVEVTVVNAASTITNDKGEFTLNFRTLHAGDLVTIRRIQKEGYEIFNKEALEQWIISGRKDIPFTIVMCPIARFKQMRDNYERVSSANYEVQFQKEKAQLARKRQEGKISQSQYESAVQKANVTLQQNKAQVAVVAEKFSRIDLSEVSQTEREVINMVQEGKIEQAITTAEERGDMIHLADLYLLAGGVENMEKADSLLRRAAWSDTTQITPMLKYAEFAYMQSDWNHSLQAYRLCLRHIGNDQVRRANLSMNLGILYFQLNEKALAQQMFDQAESDMLALSERDAEGWLPSLCSVQLALANMQMDYGRLEPALKGYLEVCNHCEQILAQDSTRQDILRLWLRAENNAGIVYMRQQEKSKAQKTLQAALMRSQKLQHGEYETAAICHSLGTLYLVTDHLPQAESRLKQCERLLLPLMARNPQAIMADLARCYHNLYRVCNAQEGRRTDAIRYLDTAIAQYRILAERQPQIYQARLNELLQIKGK